MGASQGNIRVTNVAKHYPKLSRILQKLLYERRLSPSELARETDLPVPTVHRLVTGKSTRPYLSSLKPIADYFLLNVKQLLGEEPIPELEWEKSESKLPISDRIKAIPIITWEAANNLKVAMEQSNKKIAATGNISEQCFALLMNDHSMEPIFPKNTILIFDPLRTPADRSYVLVKLEGKLDPVFRQLLIDVDYKYLKPLNPDLNTYKMRLLAENDQIIACLFESRTNHQSEDNFSLEEIQ